ncbi:MAG: hypothetical protein QM500_04905 [Methylococcales bacterium]
MVMPAKLILKTHRTDFLGIVLELIKETEGSCATAYYAKMKGSCSKIEHVGVTSLKEIENGEHDKYFVNIEDLHKRVEIDINRDLSCINKYRNTGDYFERVRK